MFGVIYKITNLVNNKVYIGQTVQSLKDRWYRHCSNNNCLSEQEKNMHIKRAIMKYGKHNFKIEILEHCAVSLLDEREIYYIKYYNSYKNGYNKTEGGKLGRKPLKINDKEQSVIIELYKYGFSLSELSREFNIDNKTVKGILIRNNIKLRDIRNYKYDSTTRNEIINLFQKGVSRKTIIDKYHISKSYLSQLLSGKRRI